MPVLSRLRALGRVPRSSRHSTATAPVQPTQSNLPDHYTLLGLSYTASCDDVRTRFLDLQELVSVLPEVFNAFHVLSDEERKAEYDKAFFLSNQVKTGGKFVSVLQTAGKLLAMGAEPASCPKVGKFAGDRSSFFFDPSGSSGEAKKGPVGGKFVEEMSSEETASVSVDVSDALV